MIKAKSKDGFELGVGHLQLQVVSPVHQLLAVVFYKETLFVANANSVHLTCRWACENTNSIDFIIKLIWSSSTQFLDPLEFNSFSLRLCQFGTSKLFVHPSQGFVLSYMMVNGLATESADKQVYRHGWHHYNGHSCIGEGNNQFHQHTITFRILCS